MIRRDYLVTVCDSCLKASCWHGKFFCEDYRMAGTQDLPVSTLRKLKLEHPSYYSKTAILKITGQLPEALI